MAAIQQLSASPIPSADSLELSIVIPCLNEEETIVQCVINAISFLTAMNLKGEVLVVDNGSTDRSREFAEQAGARVVSETKRGYGNTLIRGIHAARGKYIAMGDADGSYDFTELGPFVELLRNGCDLVMGNRFTGRIMPGAMPFLHKYLGNPVLSWLGRVFFSNRVGDFHCGMRAFRREAALRMDLRSTGMEFASELVVKASLNRMRIAEVPITLRKDGRSRPPHLRTWRDGWRHLVFLLLYSPNWLFLFPGLMLMIGGAASCAWLLTGPQSIGVIELDIHTLLYGAVAIILGFQISSFALFSVTYGVSEGLLPTTKRLWKWTKGIQLEYGIALGAVMMLAGFVLSLLAVRTWASQSFGHLIPSETFRQIIPATLLMVVGMQVIASSFFLAVLRVKQK